MKIRYGLLACATLLSCLCGSGWAQDADSEQGSSEPTQFETLVLEMINRARENSHEEALRCVEVEWVMEGVDRETFLREMQGIESCPPVFFDPRLVESARLHSEYQVLHGICHDEVQGREGFTGVNAKDRAEAAGYSVVGIGENVATGFTEAEQVHSGFIIDPAGQQDEGPGGMQPGRPHRVVTYKPEWRLVGVGSVVEDGAASTVVYANADQRFVGGVIYCDRDGDGFYSLGEGLEDTSIVAGRNSVQGYRSGAYTIPVASGAGRLEFRIGPLNFTRRYARGNENVKVDIVLSLEEEQAMQRVLTLQNYLLQCARSADINDAAEAYQKIKQEYGNTALGPWLADVEVGLQMRQIYIDTANRYVGQNLPSEAELTRTLQQLQTMHRSMATPQWKDFGREIGEAFLVLGQTGQIDSDLISTESSGGMPLAQSLPADNSQQEDRPRREDRAPAAQPDEAEGEGGFFFGPGDGL